MNTPDPELIAKLPLELAAASSAHGAGMVKLSPYSEIAERSTGGVLRALRISLDAARDVVCLMVSVLAHLAGGRILRYPASSAWMPEQLQPSYLLSSKIAVESKPGRNARVLSTGAALASVVRLEDALWLVLRARHGCAYDDGLSAVRAFIASLVRAGQDEGIALPNAEGKRTGPFINVEAADALGTVPDAQKTEVLSAAVIRATSQMPTELDARDQVELLVQHEMYSTLRDATVAELPGVTGLSADESDTAANVMLLVFVERAGGTSLVISRSLGGLPIWLAQALEARGGYLASRNPPPGGGQFANLVEAITPVLTETLKTQLGLSPPVALRAAHAFLITLATLFVGTHLYWPLVAAPKSTRRKELIVERLKTRKAKDVALEFGISYVRVHQIYREHLRDQDQRLRDEVAQQQSNAAADQRPPASPRTRSATRVKALAAKERQRGPDAEGPPIFASAQRYARDVLQQRSDRQVLREGRRADASRSDD